MRPVDALTEIAELLERNRASRYKSKAFRAAAETVAGLSAAEQTAYGLDDSQIIADLNEQSANEDLATLAELGLGERALIERAIARIEAELRSIP